MIGDLPVSITVNGHEYSIDSDFRNILVILSAFADDELTNTEKGFICMDRLFDDFKSIPKEDIQGAYKGAIDFINFLPSSNRNSKHQKFLDWEKDEQLIFPAINAVAGTEVRLLKYMHWWTFMGYFQNIDSESLFGSVLSIRQKRAKGKKLEKWELEFERNNIDLISLKKEYKDTKDKMQEIFDSLPEEDDEEEGG